jgi:DNA-binding transcriptional regulator YiaG
MIKALCLPLKVLAEELETSYSNVRNWSSGAKEIPDKYRKPLAAFMRKHARRLEKAADEMGR